MNVRNDGLASPRLVTQQDKPTTPAPVNTVRGGAVQADTFVGGAAKTQAVSAAPAGDHGKLMNEYLTGARPPPADFEKVMGYSPFLKQTEAGPRMQDPHGFASSPGGIGPVEDFDVMAKTHDYGYDLLRYFDRKGTPLQPAARKAADKMFREDLFVHANNKDGLVDRWKSRSWAQVFATAVELNSRVQGYGPP